MKNKKIYRSILIICIVLWAVLVFGLSNQTGESSSGLSRKIASILFKSEEMIDLFEPYIRKLAHFSEYTLGGMLFISLFLSYDWSEKRQMVTSICLGVWYAALDEAHQLLVPKRSGNIMDVLIDTLGICFGVCVILCIDKIRKRIQNKQKEKSIKTKLKGENS